MRKYFLIAATVLLLTWQPAWAVKVADITRLAGQRTNKMEAVGLIVGLPGSGDGGDYLPAIRPLAALLTKFGDSASVLDLSKAANIAIVNVTATVPSSGVRNGDHLDCYVTSIGAASSLKGGRLFICPMQGPVPGSGILALAEGQVVVEDPTTPTSGVVTGGAVMEADLIPKAIDNGRFTLVIDEPAASYSTANTIAQMINSMYSPDSTAIAQAADQKNVVVTIPDSERQNPDSFISRVQELVLPPLTGVAEVKINQATGTIIVTGDVEISPVVISHKGLTISTINPAAPPAQGQPVVSTKGVVTLDTANQGGAKLQDLADAFDRLNVPPEDRITIVKELYDTGKLHAKLVIEQK